ncbi:MAG: acetate--CoA ligase family protein, partial [Solirubrobacterales bacterium]
SPEAAAEAAEELGGPVALKAEGEGLLHKTEMGAVRIGLSADQVAGAAKEMDGAVSDAGAKRESFIVQEMVGQGAELLIGVADDPTFGPVLACGAGGTRAELLRDVSIRITPITRTDAGQMIRSLATFPLLTGFRGAPHADLDAIEDQLLGVSAMVEAHKEIAEMDLNPVVAGPEGALAVDYRIRLRAHPPKRSWPRTWK